MRNFFFIITMLFGVSGVAAAEQAADSQAASGTPAASATTSAPTGGTGVTEPSAASAQPPSVIYPWKKVHAGDRDRACRSFEGQYISYYGEIYRVENCHRRAIHSQRALFDIMGQVNSVVEVDGKTISSIPEGSPIAEDSPTGIKRGCKDLEGKYITHSYVDVFFVEKCRKRLLPDWETYLAHRQQRGDEKSEIVSVNWDEFSAIQLGKDVPSVVDVEMKKLLEADKAPDVLPAAEACEGLEGVYASYYSRLYRIEHCRKREINPDSFFDKRSGLNTKVVELTSQQWISIPDGKPMP